VCAQSSEKKNGRNQVRKKKKMQINHIYEKKNTYNKTIEGICLLTVIKKERINKSRKSLDENKYTSSAQHT